MRILSTILFLACLVSTASAVPVPPAAEIIAVIAPATDEQAWLSIPWETDLTTARRKAVAENKPVFLWEMDGHPLGCT